MLAYVQIQPFLLLWLYVELFFAPFAFLEKETSEDL